jgi:hypothetical protein
MMQFDLERLFEHPFSFRSLIPSAIVILGDENVDERVVRTHWKQSASADSHEDELLVSWDLEKLRANFREIDEEIESLRQHDDDRATQIELAAVVVAVAVMANIDSETQFTRRSSTGTRHDYYLNNSRTEMIEVAGRSQGGLDGLFNEKRKQSDLNPKLKKRWVSVTVFGENARNRTEGLHT